MWSGVFRVTVHISVTSGHDPLCGHPVPPPAAEPGGGVGQAGDFLRSLVVSGSGGEGDLFGDMVCTLVVISIYQ